MKQFNLKLRKKISQLLHSVAKNIEPPDNKTVGVLEKPTEQPSPRFKLPRLTLPALSPKLQKLAVVPSKIQRLYQRYPLHQHPKFWFGLGITLGMGTTTLVVAWNIYRLESTLPKSVDEVLTYAPEGSLTIQAADGTILQQVGDIPYEHLKLWQFPDYLLKAFIASEDRRFQEHHGVDFQGISRAVISNLLAKDVVEGGSTITQQLARMVFLSQERSFNRKIREMRVAQKIEQRFDKAQILESYLNFVYLGSGAYGVADASWIYFSKPVEKLTLTEAATLAGIVPAPSLYSPIENQKAAKQRRDLVLKRMEEQGFITPQQAATAIASPLTINPSPPKRLQRQAPYFTEYIQKELPRYLSKDVLSRGGLIVETTLNPKWQQVAQEKVDQTVSLYGRWQRFSQAALVAIDPRNGQIKAMVGGNDFEKNQYNRVTQAKRQPGSTFKTFVYSTAIAAGFSPYQGFLDAEYVVDGYKPENYGDTYSGQYVSMRNALTKSLNVVAVKTLVDVGWNPIIRIAKRMGIESPLKPTYSLALGASEVNLLEITSAYGTLANKGVHQPAYGISRIIDRNGKILYQADFKPVKAIDEGTSAIMTWMLQGVVNDGTGQPAQIGRPVAGKTGTSDKARDLWFIGYIPQLVTGIWLGNDDNQPTWGASSTSAALWRQFMLPVVQNMPIVSFESLPPIDGRKGSIKAEPIKPKNSYYKMPEPQPTEQEAQTTNNNTQVQTQPQTQPEPRRRRRRRRNQEQAFAPQPVQPRYNYSYRRRRSTTFASSPPRQSAPAPVATSNSAPTPAAPAAESVPVSAPVTSIAPPAPPAAHKSE
ncbi:transglycosylase domain-containing protein [Gloeothece verrucosa]|uniref:Penicillin-binding protein, 1A family n=1 Tax=Gloeothece verrucosa (strain PCC 7822) TaxID=497965 RepID=E0UAW4_GLOV7|nr:PBP1A family penicillin-binding protein [Gloeothece verrucosa]ADN15086.1 penicillin-binding protein, 1A family [Gloeothece verrucosa PCC 7822]